MSAFAYYQAEQANADMVILTAEDLGLLIRSRRRELGWDQQALATRIGVSRLWVVEFEKGKPRAEVALVLRALGALGLRVDVSPAAAPTPSAAAASFDIDAVVRAARKKR